MKKSYWLYKMCLLLGLGICIPVTGNASDIGDATLTQQQSKITASGVVVDESGESLIGASVIEKGAATNGTITSNPQLSSSASFLRLNVLSSLN